MGRRRHFAPLNVFLNTKHVGTLLREKSGAVSFVYDRTWLEWEHRLPISLSMPLREDRYIGGEAIPVFDNLLPDNPAIRRRVAERVGAAGTDAFSLLSEIGRDCVGALQFLPEGEEPQPQDRLTGEPLNETQIEAILNALDVAPLGIRSDNTFRISVAGAQEKTALLFHNGQWIEPSGTTPTTHIIKPQIGRLPNGMDLSNSVENEYFCLKLLQAFGLRTAEAEMARFGDRRALVVKRFDRLWTQDGRLIRLPQEDMCQALSVPSTQKYQSEGGPGIDEIMETLRGSDEPTQDRLDFFKANVLFWLIGATDGHAKNFSIGLLPGGRFRLTPFYDVMTVQPTFDAGELQRKDFKLAMRLGKSHHYRVADIVWRHLVETGLQAGLSRTAMDEVFAEITEAAEPASAATLDDLPSGFPDAIGESVRAAILHRLKMLRDSA